MVTRSMSGIVKPNSKSFSWFSWVTLSSSSFCTLWLSHLKFPSNYLRKARSSRSKLSSDHSLLFMLTTRDRDTVTANCATFKFVREMFDAQHLVQ
ncbi:hypothetical protein Bca4012_006522 [Brassica carinata]